MPVWVASAAPTGRRLTSAPATRSPSRNAEVAADAVRTAAKERAGACRGRPRPPVPGTRFRSDPELCSSLICGAASAAQRLSDRDQLAPLLTGAAASRPHLRPSERTRRPRPRCWYGLERSRLRPFERTSALGRRRKRITAGRRRAPDERFLGRALVPGCQSLLHRRSRSVLTLGITRRGARAASQTDYSSATNAAALARDRALLGDAYSGHAGVLAGSHLRESRGRRGSRGCIPRRAATKRQRPTWPPQRTSCVNPLVRNVRWAGSAGVSTGRRDEPACGPGGTSPGTPWRPPHADGALRNGEDESPPGGSAGAKRHAPAAPAPPCG